MAHKFLRDTGEFAFPVPSDIGISTTTTTGILTFLANSLTTISTLTTTGVFTDGPAVAQGSSGIWYASGTVTVFCSNGACHIDSKLWDGSTIIDSSRTTIPAANNYMSTSLSGAINGPAGNIRISVAYATATAAVSILSNAVGSAKDSTITAIRIG